MMRITIDKHSGFCFGVVYAIEMAESILRDEKELYCLGDIVHNNKEVDRLNALGLKIIMSLEVENFFNWGSLPETCLQSVSLTIYLISLCLDLSTLLLISLVISLYPSGLFVV